jgi:hypothetical protein
MSRSDAPAVRVSGVTAPDLVVDRPRSEVSAERRVMGMLERIWQVSWRPGAIYLVSRAVVLVTMGVVAAIGGGSLGGRIYRWDSVWYLRAAGCGYPSHLPIGHGRVANVIVNSCRYQVHTGGAADHVVANTIAFFPGLPLLIRGLSGLTGMSQFSAGTAISSITGLTAVIGVWMLVREFASEQTANRVTILFAFFPGSFVFSMIYSEGLVITGAAFGLVALMRRRWVVAGLLGLVATSAAPIALAFELSCLWAAGVAIHKGRDWRALAAPVLAPLGTIAYLLWTWQHTGTLAAFSRTERGGWRSFLSIAYPFKIVWQNVAHPITTFANQRLVFFCIIGVLLAVIIAIRDRQPSLLLIYGIGVGVLALLTQPVGPRPRIILDAFPLVIAVAMRYGEGWKYKVALACSLVALVAMTAYEVASFSVFP